MIRNAIKELWEVMREKRNDDYMSMGELPNILAARQALRNAGIKSF